MPAKNMSIITWSLRKIDHGHLAYLSANGDTCTVTLAGPTQEQNRPLNLTVNLSHAVEDLLNGHLLKREEDKMDDWEIDEFSEKIVKKLYDSGLLRWSLPSAEGRPAINNPAKVQELAQQILTDYFLDTISGIK